MSRLDNSVLSVSYRRKEEEAMRERGKALEAYNGNVFGDFNYSSSDMPCKKHPSSSSVGICSICLKDRLVKLVCSECGEQRLSSCSCSDISSYRNSSCTADVGSVGRMSFLIDNEKSEPPQQTNSKPKKEDIIDNKAADHEVILLRRSASSCVEVKRYKGFWKIKKLFRKKKEKGCEKDGGFDDKSDVWVSDFMGVSRSRSLCSFRGGGFNDTDEGSDYRFSSAKISDVTGGILFDYDKQCGFNESEPRRSGFRGPSADDSEPRKSGFRGGGLMDDQEPRRSGYRGPMELDRTYSVPNRSIFPVKESDFNAMDESAFIDLKLDLSSTSSSEPKTDQHPAVPAMRIVINKESSDHHHVGGVADNSSSRNHEGFNPRISLKHSGSCRIAVNDRALKRGTNTYKIWKWFSRHHSGSGRRSTSSKDEKII